MNPLFKLTVVLLVGAFALSNVVAAAVAPTVAEALPGAQLTQMSAPVVVCA